MKTLKHHLIACLWVGLCSVAMAEPTPPESTAMKPDGKFLAGDGVEIEMAEFSAQNANHMHDVLLKMVGIKANKMGVEFKTMHYVAVPVVGGVDYQSDGKTVLAKRQQVYTAYLTNQEIALTEYKAVSKEVLPMHLFATFKAHQAAILAPRK